MRQRRSNVLNGQQRKPRSWRGFFAFADSSVIQATKRASVNTPFIGWDEVGALAALAGTLVVLVGFVAAIVQLKHLRLTYQIESYIDLMGRANSPEMVAAREYVEACVFHDPELLEKALTEGLDHRVLIYGGFYQTAARLINQGIADRDLFDSIIMTAPQVWNRLGPLAYACREHHPSNPRWAGLECLAFDSVNKPPFNANRYSAAF